MTLEQLAEKLKAIYPTAYSHFKKTQIPPFICYLDQGSNDFYADNKVFAESIFIDIELYTKIKDLAAESKIKQLLHENELPYTKSPTVFIESEGVFQCVFSIQLLG